MSGSYLLDTNIIIALFADEAVVKNNLAQADEVFVPSIAIGDLHAIFASSPDRHFIWARSCREYRF